MIDACAGEFLEHSDPVFGKAVLVVGVDPGEGKTLCLLGAMLPPSAGTEYTIVGMVVLDVYALHCCCAFEVLFSLYCFFCIGGGLKV
jgi:hypothetical protein